MQRLLDSSEPVSQESNESLPRDESYSIGQRTIEPITLGIGKVAYNDVRHNFPDKRHMLKIDKKLSVWDQ